MILKETYSIHYPGICLEALRKSTNEVRMVDVPAEIRAEDLPNTIIE
jgi:hypothetical protein